jgi:hypothetical protein
MAVAKRDLEAYFKANNVDHLVQIDSVSLSKKHLIVIRAPAIKHADVSCYYWYARPFGSVVAVK